MMYFTIEELYSIKQALLARAEYVNNECVVDEEAGIESALKKLDSLSLKIETPLTEIGRKGTDGSPHTLKL